MLNTDWMRQNKVNILKYLPEFLSTDENFKSVADTCSGKHELMRQQLQDIFQQFFIDTATWGLSDWERVFETSPSASATYDLRRALLKAKIMVYPSITIAKLEQMANLFLSNSIYGEKITIAEYNSLAKFILKIPVESTIYIAQMKDTIAEIKPAHLDFSIVAFPKKLIQTNKGSSIKTVTPNISWVETQRHITFDTGRLNSSGSVTIKQSKKEWDEYASFYVFTGARLNGINLKMNSETGVLNNDLKVLKSKTNHHSEIKSEKMFICPEMSLNAYGSISISREDIGQDAEVTERFFIGSRTNSDTKMNGTGKINNAAYREITRTVHVPIWRDVVKRSGWYGTNQSKHHAVTVQIPHTSYGAVRKTFDPNIGTLTNNHAGMGYFKL